MRANRGERDGNYLPFISHSRPSLSNHLTNCTADVFCHACHFREVIGRVEECEHAGTGGTAGFI